MSEGHERQYGDLELVKRMAIESKGYIPHLSGIFVLSLLYTPLALLGPVPLAIAVDSVIGDHGVPGFIDALLPDSVTETDTALLIFVGILFVAITLFEQILNLLSSLLSAFTSERIVLDMRGKLFRHVQRLSLSFHDTRGTADSSYRIQYDAYAIQQLAMNTIVPLVTAVVTLVTMLYVTARIDWQLALVALTVSPLLVFLSHIYRRKLRKQSRQVKRLESGGLGVIQEVLTGMRVVKAFGQEEREEERFVSVAGQGMGARIKLALSSAIFGSLIAMTTALGTGIVLYVGVRHVQNGTITLGQLLLIMTYLSGLYKPLKTVAKKAGSLQSSLASAERVFSLLDEVPDVQERPHARPLTRARGAVELRDVSFSYDGEREVLHGISLELEPGQKVGIAGRTGAGKSTLVSLLNRFYDPTSGAVLLDGVDLRDYRIADLRDQFGIVLQEPVLFSTTIRENIAYARPDASQAEIEAAARAANIHDFIAGLADGYETQVGERGMRLSGGERQRISVARAFLKDAPILILDEPTSSVDTKTEAGIIEAMERLMEGRTTFMIAHRLSTLEGCDVRLEIEDGRLVEPEPAEAAMIARGVA